MTDPMQEIRASFFVECEELLEALQDGLQTMSDGSAETETINVVFRAVHSIKGGAGAFGLDGLVRFAHKFENALDAVRAGELTVDDALVSFFYRCGDILSDLVRSARDEEALDPATIEPVLEELLKLTGDEGDEVEDTIEFTPTALSLDLDGVDGLAGAGDDMWDLALPGDLPALDAVSSTDSDASHGTPIDERNETTFRIVFSPEPELYSGGNEPLFLFTRCQFSAVRQKTEQTERFLPPLIELGFGREDAPEGRLVPFVDGRPIRRVAVRGRNGVEGGKVARQRKVPHVVPDAGEAVYSVEVERECGRREFDRVLDLIACQLEQFFKYRFDGCGIERLLVPR